MAMPVLMPVPVPMPVLMPVSVSVSVNIHMSRSFIGFLISALYVRCCILEVVNF